MLKYAIVTATAVISYPERVRTLSNIVDQVGNLPPVHWLTHLGVWHHAPFSWVGDLLGTIFSQHLLQWSGNRLGWLIITIVVLSGMTLELVWWLWSWMRGRQVGYDSRRAEYWTTGPRAGQRKSKPINLVRARARRFAWPMLGLPLYLVAVSMYLWYLVWPGDASRLLMAMLWFVFTPVRRAMFIAVARKAYRANHPNDRLETSLLEDVYNYFFTGVARPANKQRYIEPPFENTSWFYRFLNWGHASFSKYGTFWRVFRFWNFLRFWGLLVQLFVAFFWPIAAVAAPFFYMSGVEDYEDWMNPWWRRYRKSEYHGKVIKGTVVTRADNPA